MSKLRAGSYFLRVSNIVASTIFCFAATHHSFGASERSFASILEPIRDKYKLPAIGGAIFNTDGIVEIAAVGVRKVGTSISVTKDDEWHLGSDTKAMTAMLAATFVAEGKLSWHDKAIRYFPQIAGQIPAKARDITISQLLTHEAGLAAATDSEYWKRLTPSGSLIEQRLKAAHAALLTPEYEPGTFHYSNNDYIVIGAILERIGGKSWEDEMRERIFAPLGMNHAGFGGTGTVGLIDQPWPHLESGQPAPSNGSMTDLPAVLRPAGGIHCTMQDWAGFLIDQLRGVSGMKALLPQSVYKAIQTAAPGTPSGYGWGVTQEPWANGQVLAHAGSNGMNYSLGLLVPNMRFGVVVCTNEGGDKLAACNEAARVMIARYLAKTAAQD